MPPQLFNHHTTYWFLIGDRIPMAMLLRNFSLNYHDFVRAVHSFKKDMVFIFIVNMLRLINSDHQMKLNKTFSFQPVSSLEVRNEIDQLNRSKKTNGELSTDIVKSIADNCLEYITYYANHMFASSIFPR